MALTVLLAALKTILLVLLGIIATFVLLLLVLLFVPFCFRVRAEKYGFLSGTAVVTWLFGIIRFVIIRNSESGQVVYLRIFGIKLQKSSGAEALEGKISAKDTGSKQEVPQSAAFKADTAPKYSETAAKSSKAAFNNELKAKRKQFSEPYVSDTPSANTRKEKRRKREKQRGKPEESGAFDTFKQIMEIANKRGIINQVLLLLKRLLKIIFNIKLFADFKFGTGKPDTTGYLLGLCYAATCLAGMKINAEGDFENASLTGRAEAKGRIFICAVLWAILMFVFNKEIFSLIKKYVFKRG